MDTIGAVEREWSSSTISVDVSSDFSGAQSPKRRLEDRLAADAEILGLIKQIEVGQATFRNHRLDFSNGWVLLWHHTLSFVTYGQVTPLRLMHLSVRGENVHVYIPRGKGHGAKVIERLKELCENILHEVPNCHRPLSLAAKRPEYLENRTFFTADQLAELAQIEKLAAEEERHFSPLIHATQRFAEKLLAHLGDS